MTSSNILDPVPSDEISDIRFLAAEVLPANNFQIHAHFPISGDIYYTDCTLNRLHIATSRSMRLFLFAMMKSIYKLFNYDGNQFEIFNRNVFVEVKSYLSNSEQWFPIFLLLYDHSLDHLLRSIFFSIHDHLTFSKSCPRSFIIISTFNMALICLHNDLYLILCSFKIRQSDSKYQSLP